MTVLMLNLTAKPLGSPPAHINEPTLWYYVIILTSAVQWTFVKSHILEVFPPTASIKTKRSKFRYMHDIADPWCCNQLVWFSFRKPHYSPFAWIPTLISIILPLFSPDQPSNFHWLVSHQWQLTKYSMRWKKKPRKEMHTLPVQISQTSTRPQHFKMKGLISEPTI